jgi:UDP-glucose 4-epimerase
MIDKSSKVLVTGGKGFIGSHLVEHLLGLGARVTVLDSLSSGNLGNLQSVLSSVEFISGELGGLLTSKQIELGAYQYIFHLAANSYIPPSIEDPLFDFRANLQNTILLLEALRHTPNAPRLLNTSSAAVYGNPVRMPIQESDATVPISPYGVSKLAAECYVSVYSSIYGVRANSVRLFSVYGPRQRKQVVYDLLCKLRADPERLEVMGDGSQMRDFIYVKDVVSAMTLMATVAPGRGEAYNVASGVSYSIAELVQACCKVCGVSPKVCYTGQMRSGDADKWSVDLSMLKQLDFKPCIGLEAGLAAIRDWYDNTKGK